MMPGVLRSTWRVSPVVAIVVLGCGGGDNVGTRWAQAVDDERWDEACALMPPRGDCEQRLQREYEGRDVELLEAGGYQAGSNVTDNKTRFAISAAGRGPRSTAYYEVERRGGRDVVDVKIVVSEP
jgi:hypothetical protein